METLSMELKVTVEMALKTYIVEKHTALEKSIILTVYLIGCNKFGALSHNGITVIFNQHLHTGIHELRYGVTALSCF